MMDYIFITYDAIEEFTSGRFFQSYEFSDSVDLCKVLKGETFDWNHRSIHLIKTERGIVYYAKKFDKKNGIIFDLTTFNGFRVCGNDKIIMMFQRILKYAIRYYQKIPLVRCERNLSDGNTAMVFPFPFSATASVDKVLIDKNSFKEDRKGNNYLTVFFFGKESENFKFSSTVARKSLDDLSKINVQTLLNVSETEHDSPINITVLNSLELSIDAEVGFSSWEQYLTGPQKQFVMSPVKGPERLEGAAGTGKTISLILRCIHLLKQKSDENEEYHIIFITHSLATKERIINIFKNNWPSIDDYLEKDGYQPYISLAVTTLQEWSGNHLGTHAISETEYLDKDASDAKELQKMYIEQALSNLYEKSIKGLEIICSPEFLSFLANTPRDNKLEMLQQEIAVLIKGRANGELEAYKELHRPKYALPIKKDADKSFMFSIFTEYQKELDAVNQYDSDDIIISALGNIKTPIWKRRRNKEGYDVCFIDETHLFNLNELSIFQYVNKEQSSNHIIYAIDRSQAVGDLGLSNEDYDKALKTEGSEENDYKFQTVFRCSPDIVNLAFNILSSGATFYTNFENPLDYSVFNFTRDEENKCKRPLYHYSLNDQSMIEDTFRLVESFCKETKCTHSKILIVAVNCELLSMVEKYANNRRKPIVKLKGRNDANTIRQATYNSKYVIGSIDSIGGLEFDAVFMVGVDKNRVPPTDNKTGEAYHFLDYAWHNRMYVAVTRAKYHVCFLGSSERGRSCILESAYQNNLLDEQENS